MDSGTAQEYDVFTSTLSGSSDSASAVGWLGDAGTSAASPIWAGLIAIADQGRALAGLTSLDGPSQTLPALYQAPAGDFHAVGGQGFSSATGLGSPVANRLIPALVATQGGSTTTLGHSSSPTTVTTSAAFGSIHSATTAAAVPPEFVFQGGVELIDGDPNGDFLTSGAADEITNTGAAG